MIELLHKTYPVDKQSLTLANIHHTIEHIVLGEHSTMDASMNIFGIRLREVREKRGLSQKELAEMTGGYVSNMSYYESGRRIPSLELFVKIARVLGVSTDYLLGNTDEEGILFDEEVRSVVRDYQSLNPRDRETVSYMIKFLSQK